MRPEQSDPVFAHAVIRGLGDRLFNELTTLKNAAHQESIHDTRVQSRRMRAALEAFADLFPPARWKALYELVRYITKALGRPREAEVLLSMLKGLAGSGDLAQDLCLEYLQERFKKKFQKQERQLKRDLRTVDPKRLRLRIEQLLAALGGEAGGPSSPMQVADDEPEAPSGPPRKSPRRTIQANLFPACQSAMDRGYRVIGELATPILAVRARSNIRRASDRRLHQLRICVKKLRYAMEIFGQAWPEGLDREIELARALQEATGQHQDWVVLREEIRSEIRRLTRQETTQLALQMGRLLAHVQDRKAELRSAALPAFADLQMSLQGLLRVPGRPSDSNSIAGNKQVGGQS